MASFNYKAVDAQGALQSGVLVADGPEDARARLRRMGLFPENVERVARSGGSMLDRLSGRARGAQYVTIFTRQLAVLLTSGVPATNALEVLARQTEHKGLSLALQEIVEAVNAGRPLAESMASYPHFFDRAYVGMIASGEKSGTMDIVCSRLAEFLERRRQMQSRISTALIYPAILALMIFVLLIFLSGYVVPVLKPLLAGHNRPLPLTTHLLFILSDAVRKCVWGIAPAALFLAAGAAWWRRSERRRAAMDVWLLRVPVIGKLWLKSLLARFAMAFSTLLRTGVPAMDALEMLQQIIPNAAFATEIGRVRRDVIEGGEISARMQSGGLFPPMVGYMIAVGERSGSLSEVLEHLAASYDQEVEVTSRRLLAVLEPGMVLAMAGMIGFIVTSLMITILELSRF